MTALSQILDRKIVVILRGLPAKNVLPVAEALYAGGIRVLEVTLNSAEALPLIAQLREAFEGRMLIGAGTVLNKTDATNSIAAGAAFLVSPTLDTAVIKAANHAGVVSIPGAFTPTEILSAHNHGADIVKIFPSPDAGYIKNILAPLNHIRVMPVGGIDVANIKSFAATGAVAFGIGSALVNNASVINETYLAKLSQKARQLMNALNS